MELRISDSEFAGVVRGPDSVEGEWIATTKGFLQASEVTSARAGTRPAPTKAEGSHYNMRPNGPNMYCADKTVHVVAGFIPASLPRYLRY